MKPQLVPQYHRAKFTAVTTAAAVFLWKFKIDREGGLPLVRFNILDDTKLPYIYACILAYALINLLIAWAQSDSEHRRRFASRLDLGVTLLICLPAAGLLAPEILPPIELPAVSLVSSFALIALGIAVGELIDSSLFGLVFIRSREEARRLALPRVPVAVRVNYRLAYVVVPAFSITLLLAPSFSPPMASLWPWFVCTPVVILLLSGTAALALHRYSGPDGARESRRKFIEGMRLVHDRHDAHYQLGRWDKPIPPSNSQLYHAAEVGEFAIVRELLRKGEDPNERNMHGWTPLMIAVAERHLDTARLLLEKGGSPNRSNLFGRNSLMFAAIQGDEDLVRELLAHGANPDLNESNDPSALSVAAQRGHLEVVRMLLEAGADATLRDDDGWSALDYAEDAKQGEIASLLRRAERDRAI